MPIEVNAKDEVSAQKGQSRNASPTVTPGAAVSRSFARPGAPRSIFFHGSTSSSGMNNAVKAANTR